MRRSVPQDDRGAADLMGTLLLVVVVVALGSVLAVVVTATLSAPSPSPGAYALAPVAPGDASFTIRYQNGAPIALGDLRVLLARNGSGLVDVPSATWTTLDPDTLRAGDALEAALTPPAAPDETLRVTVLDANANAIIADLSQRASAGPLSLGAATLAATLTPPGIAADGVSPTLVEVRVSHPLGALAVASVSVDLGTLYASGGAPALTVALNDEGRDGDAVGGDAVWSARVLAPPTARVGTYPITIQATDGAGAPAGNATLQVLVEPPLNGLRASEGTRFLAPNSSSMTALRIRNFTYDQMHPARVEDDALLVRIAGSGKTWSAHVVFDLCGAAPCATQLTLWHDSAETVYAPVGTLPLASLDLDLLDPVGSGRWTISSGATPSALYPAAGVAGNATFSIVAMRDVTTPGARDKTLETGIYSVDLVVR